MKTSRHPVRTTIFFGLACGLAFIPVLMVLGNTALWPLFFRLTMFAFVAAYAFILASWSGKNRITVLFPLLLLIVFAFSRNTSATFLLLSAAILSWIRSGVCFENPFVRSLGAELVSSIGSGAMVVCFNPSGTLGWALEIWLFFLIQSLYFLVMGGTAESDPTPPIDPFEQARIKAEGILKKSKTPKTLFKKAAPFSFID